jgi:poly(hydroxyalkanoate) depolymerase family esterase
MSNRGDCRLSYLKKLPDARFLQKLRRAMPRDYLKPTYDSNTRLREVFDFGPNPGNLLMFDYRPPSCGEHPPLVVVLHGCTQTAASYDLGAGWSTLADRYGFALLVPEQQRVNNPNGCFNWFLPGDSRRDQGEAFSIRQMIGKSVLDHGINTRRIFVTGLSAGGAMASVMLACYPDVFAGGAIIAGLPYGAATNVQQAFESMYQGPSRSAREWGDLVRAASSYRGPWPKISVWHGNADQTVIPANAREIMKQWTDVHELSLNPSAKRRVDGFPREVWTTEDGEELIEAYTIPNMAHGTPLAVDANEGACGVPGPFLLPVGISSSYHIAKFFGIAAVARSAARLPAEIPAASAGSVSSERILEGEVLDRDEEPISRAKSAAHMHHIGEVINKALRTAGLIR